MKNSFMKNFKQIMRGTAAASFVIMAASNALLAIEAQDSMDTPQSQYDRGMQATTSGDLKAARDAYARAVELDKKFVNGYKGLLSVAIQANNFGDAREAYKKGKRIAKKRSDKIDFATLYMKLLSAEKSKGWYSAVKRTYRKNLRMAARAKPKSMASEFYLIAGNAYTANNDFDDARKVYAKLLIAGGEQTTAATEKLELIASIERASVGGKNIKAIASKPEITRIDVITLLTEMVNIEKTLAGSAKTEISDMETATDGGSDYASLAKADAIRTIHRMGLRFPRISKGKFEPNKKVMRIELAMLLEDIMAIQENDPSIKRKYIGSVSPFSDLKSSHVGFNALMTAINRNLISATSAATAQPFANINGSAAIEALRKLGMKK